MRHFGKSQVFWPQIVHAGRCITKNNVENVYSLIFMRLTFHVPRPKIGNCWLLLNLTIGTAIFETSLNFGYSLTTHDTPRKSCKHNRTENFRISGIGSDSR